VPAIEEKHSRRFPLRGSSSAPGRFEASRAKPTVSVRFRLCESLSYVKLRGWRALVKTLHQVSQRRLYQHMTLIPCNAKHLK